MNAKKIKLLRKSAKKLGLNYDIQKKIYRGLDAYNRKIYASDVAMLLQDEQDKKILTGTYR